MMIKLMNSMKKLIYYNLNIILENEIKKIIKF